MQTSRIDQPNRSRGSNGTSCLFVGYEILQTTLRASPSEHIYNAQRDIYYDVDVHADELCLEYLLSFLGGTIDALDNYEGIQNAYVGAYCASVSASDINDDDHDDYISNTVSLHYINL